MSITRRKFLGGAAAFAGGGVFAAESLASGKRAKAKNKAKVKPLPEPEVPDPSPYERADGRATDTVMARRLYVDLAGRIPTKEEAQDYYLSQTPGKRRALVERLLAADDFADYWSMRFCDILRVKSEFPINLWPNAVYVYHRRIRTFVAVDESWEHFTRALVLATGSDFRDAEANFLRATAQRTPAGMAEAAARTFLGWEWKNIPAAIQKQLAANFACVRIKNTREWKEEIVHIEGHDGRVDFLDRLFGEWKDRFAEAFVELVHYWFYGELKAPRRLVDAFVKGGYRLKPLVREIVLSPRYARGPEQGGFPMRRLDAEVLDDALCELTHAPRKFQSIAPEPFTFLPKERRSICIEDGSITSAFLLLFGRPARDSGLLSERHNEVTAKQRLYLYNSGTLFNRLGKLVDGKAYRRQPMKDIIDDLYWKFYGRPVQKGECRRLLAHMRALPSGNERWRFPRDLAWCLVNSKEFLFQH